MADLSILIPAKNEMFLGRTIADILEHALADTEVIAVLDGYLPDEPLPVDPRVQVIALPKSIGQRAATNLAAKIATGKYLMKVDAHCAFDHGFDLKLLNAFSEVGDDVTMAPAMRNLHAFDWVCPNGHRRYQGPSGPCADCGEPTTMEVVWIPKPNPTSVCYRFDRDLHFQYWNEQKHLQKGDFVESMSLQGSCFMLTKEKYFALDICSEEFMSWGQQGTEVACKTWLSGGKVIVTRRTWYAHLFRTQGGDFGFPYENPAKDIMFNRKLSQDLFMNDKWPKAIRTFRSLIEQFNPPDWSEPQGKTKAIVYYTDNCLRNAIAKKARGFLKAVGLPIYSVSRKPMPWFGHNIHLPGERGRLQMFKQILAGLEAAKEDYIFLCEHDVYYHPSHFEFEPPREDTFYYNQNNWRIRDEDGFAVKFDHDSTSQLCASRELLLREYRERVRRMETEGWQGNGYEPGTRTLERGGYSDSPSGRWSSQFPNLDIRHESNLTQNRWSTEQFRDKTTCANWQESTLAQLEGWNT